MNTQNEAKLLLEREKCYKVILSTKTEIKCDKDEIQRVIEGITGGSIIKLKQGLINPSFIVTVIEDTDRVSKLVEVVNDVVRHNNQDTEYHGGKNQKNLPEGLKPLADIFKGAQLKMIKGSEIKHLGGGN